jgi:hypothetical protein
MNTFSKILFSIALAGSLSVGTFLSRADLEVSASVQINSRADFDAPLTPYGGWIDVRGHGRCWRPAHIEADWRPYCNGTWVWTDCGWYFESDEPWAWACYHYGYWADDDEYGWIWVPDIEWGPAWVTWRVGDGYIGWAPLPPPGWSVTVAPAPWFVFVHERRFTERLRPSVVIVNRTEIINHTRVINNVTREERDIGGRRRRVVVNDGPGVDPVQKAVGHSINRVSIRDVASRAQVPAEVRHNQGTRQRPEQEQSQPQQPQTQPRPTQRERNVTQPTPTPTQPATPAPNTEPGKRTRERERPTTQPQTPMTPPNESETQKRSVQPQRPVTPTQPPVTTPAPSDKPREAPEKSHERPVETQPQHPIAPMTPSHVAPPSAPPQTVRPEHPVHPEHPEHPEHPDQGHDKDKQP